MNLRPPPCEGDALPAELTALAGIDFYGTRTKESSKKIRPAQKKFQPVPKALAAPPLRW